MKLLVAALSEKCNLNCSYCNVNKQSTKSLDPKLFVEEFYKFRQLHPTEKIQIDFYGGEPLLQIRKIKYIVENIKDDNIKYFMPTNGLALTESNLQFLIDNNIETSVSFDGLWHETNRRQLNGKGTIHRYFEKRDLFHQLPNVRCHTMVTKGCYNLLENHQYIMSSFKMNPELTLVRDVGTWDTESVNKLKEGIDELFEWYIDNADVEQMPNFILYYLKHYLNYHNSGYQKSNCGAGTDIKMFNENNNLLPCTRFEHKPDMVKLIPVYAKMTECDACEVNKYCAKGCLHEQIKNEGPIQELCDIYKHVYRRVSEMVNDIKHIELFKKQIYKELNSE
jgi:uncharacterized protein